MLNLDYLRSGAQFLPAESFESRSDPDSNLPASATQRTTAAQRLDRFYAKTSLATAMAKKLAPVRVKPEPVLATAPTAAGINVDFLRSGRQFVSEARATWSSGTEQSRNQRLEKFYQAGLKAAPDVPVRARNRRISSSSNGINVEFLRSGKQFVVRDDGPVRPSGEGAKSANARLEDFFARTLAAAKVGSAPVRTPSAPRLNINFLRSGAQFNQSLTAVQPQSTVRARQTRGQRLEKFHATSLAAAAAVSG